MTEKHDPQALEARLSRLERRSRFHFAGGLFVGLLVVGGVAGAQAGITSLYVFSANTPARATEVNANFSLVKTWIERKVGDVDTGCTDGDCPVTVSGALSANSVDSTTSVSGSSGSFGTLGTTGLASLESASVTNDLAVTAGNLTVRDGTFIEGGITSACGDDGSGSSGCVLDSNAAAGDTFGRVSADSLHTNGLGDGQTFIEGSYIDANESLHLGTGVAGGQGVQNIQLGVQSIATRDTTTNDASLHYFSDSACDSESERGEVTFGTCLEIDAGAGITDTLDCLCFCGRRFRTDGTNSDTDYNWHCIARF